MDAVITLCAEGTDEETLQAFRDVRDEVRRRLAVVFGA